MYERHFSTLPSCHFVGVIDVFVDLPLTMVVDTRRSVNIAANPTSADGSGFKSQPIFQEIESTLAKVGIYIHIDIVTNSGNCD